MPVSFSSSLLPLLTATTYRGSSHSARWSSRFKFQAGVRMGTKQCVQAHSCTATRRLGGHTPVCCCLSTHPLACDYRRNFKKTLKNCFLFYFLVPFYWFLQESLAYYSNPPTSSTVLYLMIQKYNFLSFRVLGEEQELVLLQVSTRRGEWTRNSYCLSHRGIDTSHIAYFSHTEITCLITFLLVRF